MPSTIGILALGNLLHRDEGVGIHVLNSLREQLPCEVEILDEGSSGLELLGFIENKRQLIILDAVDALYQMSFAEVLYWAHFTGGIPEEIVVIGVQSDSLDWGTDLTQKAKESLPKAVEKVLACLNRWNTGQIEEKTGWES